MSFSHLLSLKACSIGLGILFLVSSQVSANSISPDKVVRLDEKRKDCKLVDTIVGEKTRYSSAFYRRGDKALRERVIQDLKVQTVEKGGNAFFVTNQSLSEDIGSMEAFVYLCKGAGFAKVQNGGKVPVATVPQAPSEPKAVVPERPQPRRDPVKKGRFGVMLKPGMYYLVGGGVGLEGSYGLSQSWFIDAEYVFSNVTYSGDEKDVEGSTLITKTDELRFLLHEIGFKPRWFMAPKFFSSLNLLAGASLDYMSGEVGYNIKTDTFFDEAEEFFGVPFEATALTAQIGISNL